MEYNTFIDTSLNLNHSKPYHAFLDDSKPDEEQSNLDGFGPKMSSKKEEVNYLMEELNRLSVENERLTEMLAVVCRSVNVLRHQMKDYVIENNGTSNDQIIDINGALKRKAYGYNKVTINDNNGSSSTDHKYSSCKKAKEELIKPKIQRIITDGYQWRKYGQKVTRDNPWPRAYFKCSFALTCPAKKKVQRSIEEESVLVATYEGKHNHPIQSDLEGQQSASTSVTQGSPSIHACSTTSHSSSRQTITLNLTKPKSEDNEVKDSNNKNVNSQPWQEFLVNQMASSLSKDSSFRTAIPKAISGRLLQPN